MLLNIFCNLFANESFEKLNEHTAYIWVEKAIKNMKNPDSVKESYIKRYKLINHFLYIAASKTCIDFSCYNQFTEPQVIEFTAKIPKCIYSLMLDYQYGIKNKKTELIKKALFGALQVDSITGTNPYIYYQLIKAANINIIFDEIKKSATESPFNNFSVEDIDKLSELLQQKKKEIKKSWIYALEFESSIDSAVLQKKLPFSTTSRDQAKESYIQRYKTLLYNTSKFIKNNLTEEKNMNILEIEAKELNIHLKNSIVAPEEWIQIYQNSMLQLDMLICIMECVKYHKINKNQ